VTDARAQPGSSRSLATDRNARIADLLARTALADQAAFHELYRATPPQLYGIAIRIVRESGMAEEILQESFIAVWHHAKSYAPSRSQPLTWMTAIVRNRCLDSLRRRDLETISITASDDDHDDLDFPGDERTPSDLLIAGADALAVRQCVEMLEGGSRQAIALAFYQGFTHAELAAHLHQPLGTVKSWVRRGLERLRQCLDRAGLVR